VLQVEVFSSDILHVAVTLQALKDSGTTLSQWAIDPHLSASHSKVLQLAPSGAQRGSLGSWRVLPVTEFAAVSS